MTIAWIVWLGCATSLLAFVPSGTSADNSRWVETASGPTGSAGDPITLTWSFVPDGTMVIDLDPVETTLPSDLIARFDAEFGVGPGGTDLMQRPWFDFFADSFARIESLTGVTYVYEPNDSTEDLGTVNGELGVRGDIRIGGIDLDGPGGTLAYNYFPSGGGDMALDTSDLDQILGNPVNDFRGLRNTIMHEAGHGLGLEHSSSGDSGFLMEPAINTGFDGPQHDDLRGFHWLYGDSLEKGSTGRNETPQTASDLGTLQAEGSLTIGAGGDGASIGQFETDFVSIANENDEDFFAFTVDQPLQLTATMTPRGASYLQGLTPFVTTETANLTLAIFDNDQQTILAESLSGAAGVEEVIDGLVLEQAGTYYVRIESATNAPEQVTQFYQLDLHAVALPLGDYNFDGVVSEADFITWRSQFGMVGAHLAADGNGDGFVDAADYTVWRDNLGAGLGAFAAPEPAAGMLLTLAITVATGASRSCRLSLTA